MPTGTALRRVCEGLRSGEWLTRERVRLVAMVLLIASVAGFALLVVTAHGGVDRQGRPLGTDFSDIYAAGTYVLEGNPAAPFDLARQHAREHLQDRLLVAFGGGPAKFHASSSCAEATASIR